MDASVLILTLVLSSLISSVLCAVVASEKNRSSGTWGIVGFFFPILSLIAIAGMPENTNRVRECLFCAELIGIKATICPFCNQELKPVVLCEYGFCDTKYLESEQAIYRLCGKEGCDKKHAFCSESHANIYSIERYNEVIGLDPDDANAFFNRAIVHTALGQHWDALHDYGEFIRLNPQDARAYHNRGGSYVALGETKKAERDFAKAKELGYDPDN